MKVQIFSDIHLDTGSRGIPKLADGVDLAVCAGDLCQGLTKAVEAMRHAFAETEVAMVGGNHEFWTRRSHAEELDAGMERAHELGVHLLENDTAILGSASLRVIGATGWTDYELFGSDLRETAMREAARTMSDHRRIRWSKDPWQRFRPQEARALHLKSRAYIDSELATPHDGPTLVLTHHACTIDAVAPPLQRSIVSAAYASSLEPIIDRHRPEYWVSGHTHLSMNLLRGRTRLISNPSGYATENPFYDPSFAIEVVHD